MAEPDRALCRRAAAECVRLARITGDIETKEVLLTRAQEWLKLAYAEQDDRLNDALADFNADRLIRGGQMHRQAEQQQQSKTKKPPQR